jgi:2-amino-4-hydroxy-6-hydroxymethyldihydropteridine diphosphokinase
VPVAYVALGSNLGDRRAHLRAAVAALPGVRRVSGVYETAPVGGPDQGPYLNCVVELDTTLDPHELLARCQDLEHEAGRTRRVRWGPRTLDVDILVYDDLEVATNDLCIPHPRMAERRFVLAPLAELAPERCPPGWEDRLPADGVARVADL